MEIEFDTVEEAKEFVKPSWVSTELTGLHNFSNATLAHKLHTTKELLDMLSK